MVAGPDHRREERDGEQHEGAGEDAGEFEHARIDPYNPLWSLSVREIFDKAVR
jgi:hypothetical protein